MSLRKLTMHLWFGTITHFKCIRGQVSLYRVIHFILAGSRRGRLYHSSGTRLWSERNFLLCEWQITFQWMRSAAAYEMSYQNPSKGKTSWHGRHNMCFIFTRLPLLFVLLCLWFFKKLLRQSIFRVSVLFCSVVPTLLPSLLIGFLAESFRNRPMMTVACSG